MAYDFDDTGSHEIDYGDVTFLDGATQISGHIWVNLDDVAADRILIEKITGGFANGFMLDMDQSGARDRSFDIFTNTPTPSTTVRVTGALDSAAPGAGWQPVGWSWQANSATGLRLYIDGTEDANSPANTTSQAATWPNISETLTAGSHESASRFMDGQLAEPAFWVGRILTAAEFAALGNGYSAAFFMDGLKFYDRLIRGSGDLITNLVGTISGATVADHPPIIYPASPFIITAPAAVGGVTMPRFYHHYQRNTG